MTEEDIMWQMENMDPDDLAALGYIPDDEEEQEEEKAAVTPDQPIEEQDDVSSPSPGQPPDQKDDQLSEEEKVEQFTVSEYKMRSRSSPLILVSFFYA
jgi:hypothetical protein